MFRRHEFPPYLVSIILSIDLEASNQFSKQLAPSIVTAENILIEEQEVRKKLNINVHKRFGGTYCLCLQRRKCYKQATKTRKYLVKYGFPTFRKSMSLLSDMKMEPSNQKEWNCEQGTAGYLLALFLDPEDGRMKSGLQVITPHSISRSNYYIV
jgi:hypothetical protein